ncbi:sensor histidine kinase [Kordia sp. SMS9]|uniref:ATP-binding protein n=1 Tax=Kordia sp. SMS9 TaxID=2282170 RepID=UPI0013B4076C|nr:sensor histidine kinase [Kordia sp. SMS9]
MFYINTNPKKAIAYSDESIQLFEKTNDSSYYDWANAHALRVDNATISNNFSNIIPHAFSAMKLYKYQKNDEKLNDFHSSLSVSYSLNGLYKPAKTLRDESILYNKKIKNYPTLVIDYLNAALDEKLQGNYTSQQEYLDKALANAALLNIDHYTFLCYHGYVVFASQQDKAALASTYFEKIKEIFPKFKNSVFHKILFLEVQAYHQYALKNYDAAEKFALEKLKLSESFNSKEILQEAHELLALIYTASGQTVKAKEQDYFVLKYLNDTKENSLKNQLVYYQTIYETEKRDLTIKNQQVNIALLDAENKVKNQWLFFGGLGLLAVFAFVWVIRSRNFARKKQKLQENFTQDILNTQEEERGRVAKELHDGVGQQLMLLTRRSKNYNDPMLENLAKDTLDTVRTISQGLHPIVLERLGFTAAVEDLVSTIDENSDIFFTSDIENIDTFITKDQALHLYRIIQETLHNTLKHANANTVFLTITKEKNTILIRIKDDGKGFEYSKKIASSKSLGMKSLLERTKIINAKLNIDSQLNRGTNTSIKVVL